MSDTPRSKETANYAYDETLTAPPVANISETIAVNCIETTPGLIAALLSSTVT